MFEADKFILSKVGMLVRKGYASDRTSLNFFCTIDYLFLNKKSGLNSLVCHKCCITLTFFFFTLKE